MKVKITHPLKPHILFFLLTLQGIVALPAQENYQWIPVILLCAVVLVLFLPCCRLLKIQIPYFTEFLLSFLLFGALVLGEGFDFYNRVFFWDNLLHTVAGALLAICGMLLFSPCRPALGGAVFSLFASALWEFYEFASDRLLGTNMQKDSTVLPPIFKLTQGEIQTGIDIGLYDTVTDMFFGFIGGLLITFIYMTFPIYIKRYLFPKTVKERAEHET